jgi:hypothetical protein
MCRPLLELVASSNFIQSLKSRAGMGHARTSLTNTQGPTEDGSVIKLQHQQLQSGIESPRFQRLDDYDERNGTRLTIVVKREFGRGVEERGGQMYV